MLPLSVVAAVVPAHDHSSSYVVTTGVLVGCVLVCAAALQVPVALATSQPERRVRPAMEKLNLTNYFDAVVTAEDNGAPEVSCSSRRQAGGSESVLHDVTLAATLQCLSCSHPLPVAVVMS